MHPIYYQTSPTPVSSELWKFYENLESINEILIVGVFCPDNKSNSHHKKEDENYGSDTFSHGVSVSFTASSNNSVLTNRAFITNLSEAVQTGVQV